MQTPSALGATPAASISEDQPIASELVAPRQGRVTKAGRVEGNRGNAGERFPVVALCGSAGALEASK